MRCEAHGLGAGPDGRCVLCREAERSAAGPSGRAMAMLGGGVVLVVLAALALYAVRPKPRVEPEPAVEPRSETQAPVAVRAGVVERPTAAPPPDRFAPSPAPSPSLTSRPVGSPAVPTASVAAPAPPSNAAIQAAFRSTPIVMFSTSWCPVCQRARAFLDANGLSREERDVDHDERARAELKRLTGKASVPTFVVDGVLLSPGFSEESLTRAVVASVEKRLNFRGIRVRSER